MNDIPTKNNPYRHTSAQIEYFSIKWKCSPELALIRLNEMVRKALKQSREFS